jgi:transposase
MAATRLLMRRLRDVLRLKYEAGLPHRAIALACAVGLGTVSSVLTRAKGAGLTWPLPAALDDAALEARLFARPAETARDLVVPTWSALYQELKRPGVTLQLLWTEYRAAHPTGYAYSHFCDRLSRARRRHGSLSAKDSEEHVFTVNRAIQQPVLNE